MNLLVDVMSGLLFNPLPVLAISRRVGRIGLKPAFAPRVCVRDQLQKSRELLDAVPVDPNPRLVLPVEGIQDALGGSFGLAVDIHDTGVECMRLPAYVGLISNVGFENLFGRGVLVDREAKLLSNTSEIGVFVERITDGRMVDSTDFLLSVFLNCGLATSSPTKSLGLLFLRRRLETRTILRRFSLPRQCGGGIDVFVASSCWETLRARARRVSTMAMIVERLRRTVHSTDLEGVESTMKLRVRSVMRMVLRVEDLRGWKAKLYIHEREHG
jgi:hypothetical protein